MRRPAAAVAGLLWCYAAMGETGITLYDDDTLRYWQDIIPEDIRWNYEHVVRPVLTPDERRRLAGVRLDFPLRSPARNPMDFYASAPPPTATMPMASLRFFGDIALAVAWLWAHDREIGIPYEYVAMLKYRSPNDFPGGRFPPPLEAMQIPGDAREDPATYDVFTKSYKSAVVFVLGHELGHLYHRHPGYGPRVSAAAAQANEAEADRFALELMRRIGDAPLGMAQFFMMMAHWEPNRWDYESAAAYEAYLADEATHPLTGHRMEALAESLESHARDFARSADDYGQALAGTRYVAAELRRIAEFLRDPDIMEGIRLTGRSASLASLRRHTGGAGATQAAPADPSFHGTFEGEIRDASGALPVVVSLERRGDQVSGTYGFGMGTGYITGLVREGSLYYEWRWGGYFGRGVLAPATDGGGYTGSWGYGQAREGAGTWAITPR